MTSLPTGWQEFDLGELLKFSNGINAGKSAYGWGTPFANVLEVINNESLKESDIPGRVSLPQKVLARYEVRRGDFLFNRTSETQEELGLASVYLGDQPVVFGGFVFRGHPLTSDIDLSYSKYALRTAEIRNQIIARGQGGIRANVGQGDLKSVKVTLPPTSEQRVVAQALDDASSQIKLLERLIAKKQAMKQGMMQQLLTGKTRLPGFIQPWGETKIGQLAEIVSGGTPKSSVPAYWDGGIPWCTPTDITAEPSRFLAGTERTISQTGLDKSAACLLPTGSLLLCTRATVGDVKIAAAPIATNQGFKSLVPRPGISNEFLYYKVLTLKDELASRGSGSTFLEVSKRDVAELHLMIPDLDEQEAIASALGGADDELTALQGRLSKARDIKQGMMQQLLTGRTRLPVPETSA